MSDDNRKQNRRRFLTDVTSGVGLAGATMAAVPFVMSFAPSERAKAAGAPVEVDISHVEPGQMLTIEWRGKPVWIVRRSAEMLDAIKTLDESVADPGSDNEDQQPGYAKNEFRSIKEEFLVLVGICTHLGCAPLQKFAVGPTSDMGADWKGGFFCPCHGSKFDLAGRVFKNVPAPSNLEVPPHAYVSDGRIIVGVDQEEGTA